MGKPRPGLAVLSATERRRNIDRAKAFREAPTVAEGILWNELRLRKVDGVRFRRQHLLAWFIVDFFAPSRGLAIEIDGPVHEQQKDYDARRQAYLESQGIRFLRFSSDEIVDHLPSAVERIRAELHRLPRRMRE